MRRLAEGFRHTVTWLKEYAARRWRHLLAWREHWHPREDTFNLTLATLVGVVGGLTNAAFLFASEWLKLFTLNQPGDPADIAELLPPWSRLGVPVLGALIAGLTLHWGHQWLRGRGSPNLLEVVVAGDGRLPFRPNLIRTASSLISVASGASIGREGSIVQLSATLASKAGQWIGSPPYRLRLLVACGAAAGMSAAYHAPIAGSVFAAQIVLGNFSMNLFAPLVCAAVVAAVMTGSLFGIDPLYHVPTMEADHLGELPWFLALGILAGVLGAAFLKLVRHAERLFEKLNQPIHVRLVVAGLITGGLALAIPEVWGNGYAVASRLLDATPRYGLGMICLLLLAKMLATASTVGSGTVGGVFTPTLFLGAALGGIVGHLLHLASWAHAPVGAYALVGMGSLLAATTHSPLLAMIMVFEISLNYSLMPGLMLACAVGTLVSRSLHVSSVYTAPLEQKGLLGDADTTRLGASVRRLIGDYVREPVPPLAETASLQEIGRRFLTSPYNFLPVVDVHQRLLGMVALEDLKAYLNPGSELQAVIAYDVMRPPPATLTPNQRLHEALPILLATDLRHIPVINNPVERKLVGAVVRAEVLSELSEAIATRAGH